MTWYDWVSSKLTSLGNLLLAENAQLQAINVKQDTIIRLLSSLKQTEDSIVLDLTKLSSAVQAETTVGASVHQLVTNMAQQIKDLTAAAGDLPTLQNQLNAFADSLTANSTQLQADVTANTTPAPAPAPAPAPTAP